MLEGIKKIKENKLLKIIWNVIYTFMFLIVLLLLLVVVWLATDVEISMCEQFDLKASR